MDEAMYVKQINLYEAILYHYFSIATQPTPIKATVVKLRCNHPLLTCEEVSADVQMLQISQLTYAIRYSAYQSINQPTNQSINQSINQ